MPATLTANIEGQTFPVDLALVTALDAMVFEETVGHPLDLKIASLIESAPETDAEWRLIDRAIIKWLFVRQAVNPDAPLAPVLASVTLFPADPPPVQAGGVDAPEAD